MVVDPAGYWTYYNASAEPLHLQAIRETDFIVRHNLWAQFKAEDAAGKR